MKFANIFFYFKFFCMCSYLNKQYYIFIQIKHLYFYSLDYNTTDDLCEEKAPFLIFF
jgi:hypothetical protein